MTNFTAVLVGTTMKIAILTAVKSCRENDSGHFLCVI